MNTQIRNNEEICEVERSASSSSGEKSVGKTIGGILWITALSFAITILCWSSFELVPDWTGTGTIAIAEVLRDVWVSLAICFCMTIWGFVCFSEKASLKASILVQILAFSVGGYFIIAAWVFGSGWCPPQGFVLFTIIAVIALVVAAIITYICASREDKKLEKKLNELKAE